MIQNIDKINPIKRGMVKKSAEIAAQCSDIEKVVVFGSSVRDDCRPDSDVDFCFYRSPNRDNRTFVDALKKICIACDYLVDTLESDVLSPSFTKIVNETGVVVYDRLS